MPESIRPARVEDADAVWPLARDFATSFAPERAAFDRTWPRLLDSADTIVLVAEGEDGAVVGYLLGHCHLTLLANGPVAWVEEVMVDAHRRRHGVGRQLMTHAERWARDAGAAYLALASRRAGAFYSALGYDDSAVFYKLTFEDPPGAR